MHEQGVVKRVVSPGVVEVALRASEACGRCGACQRDESGRVSIEARDAAGARAGDVVEIEISAKGVIAASFVVYLLPVIALIAGYGLGSLLAGALFGGNSEESAGIAGSVLFFCSQFLLRPLF